MKVILLISSILLPSLAQNLTCPYHATLVLNKCLIYFTFGVHQNAEEQCRGYGGTLVNIPNAIENRAITQFAADGGDAENIWIGAYCFGNTHSTCYTDDNSQNYLDYSNFASGYPNINGSQSGCVYMPTRGSHVGKWFTAGCTKNWFSYVCEVPPNIGPSFQNVTYTVFDSSIYYHMQGTFDDSEQNCQLNGGHLISIHSQRENDFILNRFADIYGEITLGAKMMFPNVYAWADGTPWGGFDDRDPLETADDSFKCLELFSETRLWHRTSCDFKATNICKVPLPQTTDSSQCNTTLMMVPVEFNSYGYGIQSLTATPCTYQIVSNGPYFVNLYFVEMQNSMVQVYDDSGKLIATVVGTATVKVPSNVATVVHNGVGSFKAKAMAF